MVDALHLAAGLKRVLRTKLSDLAGWCHVLDWCTTNNLVGTLDKDGYVVVGWTESVVHRAMSLDVSSQPHEMDFGTLLGYPACCCKAIAQVGEAAIDDYADRASKWPYDGEYALINPSQYTHGLALICHVPCSPNCRQSLILAKQALAFLKVNPKLIEWWGYEDMLASIRS